MRISDRSSDVCSADLHLDELLNVYIDEYAAQGGPRLNLDEMRLHNLLIVAASGIGYAMGAAIAIERDIADIDAIDSYREPRFCQHENARIQLQMMTTKIGRASGRERVGQ